MLRILITSQSRYPIDAKALKNRVKNLLIERGVTDAEVSVALVGTRKMKDLAKKYLGESENSPIHEVLSFPNVSIDSLSSVEFVLPERARLQLGDVIICYPEARKIAIKRNRMMDDVIGELGEHGTLHLLGIHHD